LDAISLERPHFAHSALVSAATLAALMLLAAVLAYWTWAWLAPRPALRARAVEALPRVETAYGLFGGGQRNRNAAAQTTLAISLMGVAAASGGKSGYAVLRLDGNKILVTREGADIAPGVRLAEVQADQIVLERNGARETLALPEKNSRARETRTPPQVTAPAESPRSAAGMDQR
jgi:general secretion pathway protein C